MVVSKIKSLACELSHEHGLPLSRLSLADLQREAFSRGWVDDTLSLSTICRWLQEDGLKPWKHRNWIFPRDPEFEEKAAPILDLYEGIWEGEPLGARDYVLSADEKTSIQARERIHPDVGPKPHEWRRTEHEYKRHGALAYFAAWDVHQAKLFGRCESKTGIEPFERFVDQVMTQEPYCSADRVFWVLDNGSSHRGQACRQRFEEKWPNAIVVHTPVHASWLNQIEIFFSILQRKALKPNNFASLHELEERIMAFQQHYEAIAKPFRWRFTREDLGTLMKKLSAGPYPIQFAA